MSQYALQVKNLTVAFKQRRQPLLRIIRGVDIDIPRGSIVGIVGESGSGKSVTTKSFLNVNYGALTSFDSFKLLDEEESKDFKTTNWKSIRGSKIAYIPQNPMTSMNPSRTIGKQILDVVNKYRKDLKTKEEKRKYILEILNRFRIINPEAVLSNYPHELSGGMKQRIIIALSVMSGAQVIIADEPTTALDSTVQSSVLELLQEVNQKEKISIIFISHNIGVVAKLCDYIYVMYAGRVVEKGNKKEIFTDPKHPYTWALISAIPEGRDKGEKLNTIPGTPPDMANLQPGDPFAPRNIYAVALDFKQEPPLFEVTPTHWAATWMLHPSYPKFEIPKEVKVRVDEFKKTFEK